MLHLRFLRKFILKISNSGGVVTRSGRVYSQGACPLDYIMFSLKFCSKFVNYYTMFTLLTPYIVVYFDVNIMYRPTLIPIEG